MQVPGLPWTRTAYGGASVVDRVTAIVRHHALAVAIVALFAVALVAPRWWVLATEPGEGARVPISPYGASRIGYDEALYTSSLRQVADGSIPARDPYLVNHQDDPPQVSSLWTLVIGVNARATGDIFSSLAVITTIGALAALALLYAMLLHLTGSRWASLALIPIILVGVHAFNQADNIFALRRWDVLKPIITLDPERQWHAWLRYPAPIMLLAPFFAAVIALPRAVETGNRKWTIAAAAALALLIYSYLFYWTAMALAIVGWGSVLLFKRDGVAIRRLAVIGGLAVLLAIPEVVALAHSSLNVSADSRDRLGLASLGVDTSLARVLGQRVLLGIPFVSVLLIRDVRRDALYASLFVAPLVLAALTGIVPQPWHYTTQIWGVFAIPAFVAGGAHLGRRSPLSSARPAIAALAFVAVLAAVYFAAFQIRVIRQTDAAFAVSADEDQALSWIRGHVSSSETVVSPSITTNLYLASLTPASQYLAEGGFSKATDAELADRMLRVQAAFGYSDADMLSRLEIDDPSGGFPVNDPTGTPAELERKLERFLAFFTFSFEVQQHDTFNARTDLWRSKYAALLHEPDVLAAYPADYLYCGHRERIYSAVSVAPQTYVRTAFSQGEVTIYQRTTPADPAARPFRGC